jgi:NAD(P)-dependent dehydrogenase (short-subunit alcohol dehydrogenase family)
MIDPILISGATSGIGLELAKSLISKGRLIITVGRNYDKFLNTIYAWSVENNCSDLCRWIEFDFSNTTGFLQSEFDKVPQLSGFVNCAGVLPISPLKLQKSADIIEVFNINLVSPVLLTRELLRSKKIVKNSSVVFISSINGLKVGSKAHACYSATKAGISGFVMSLANEVSTQGIRVNAIAPATVDTPMLSKTRGLIGEERFNAYMNQYPLGIGSPFSIIPLIEFLLDETSSKWITGQTLVVDGGFTLN